MLIFEQIHLVTIYCAILRLRFQGKIFSKKRHLLVSSDDIFTTKPDWPQQQETRKFFRLFTHFSKSRENIFWKASLELEFVDFFSVKGQIILKGLLVSSNSPKKRTNEFVFVTTTNSFIFLGKIHGYLKVLSKLSDL